MLNADVEAQYIDHFSYLDSPIHRMAASSKLAGAIGLVFLILMIPLSWTWFYYLLWAGLLLVTIASRVPLVGMLMRLRWVALVILTLSLGRLWQQNGLYEFASSVIRSGACLVTMALVANTTRFADVLQVLTAINTPKVLVTTLSLMYRYLFVLTDERNRMLRARRSRTFVGGRWNLWKTHANIITHLFVRCVDRAGRIHAAMCSRGWQ